MTISLGRRARRLCWLIAALCVIFSFFAPWIRFKIPFQISQFDPALAWTHLQAKGWAGNRHATNVNYTPESSTVFRLPLFSSGDSHPEKTFLTSNPISAYLVKHGVQSQQTVFVTFGCARTMLAT